MAITSSTATQQTASTIATGTSSGTGSSSRSTGTGTTQDTGTLNGATVRTENGESRIEINQTFDNFLTLLTTQLKNQDPVSPMDTNEFTSQLVQFTQVEQQMKSNDKLTELIGYQQTGQIAYAASLTGKEVQYEGDSAALGTTGSVEFGYTLPSGVATTAINIVDSHGAVVVSGTGVTDAGFHSLVWDGRNSSGQRAAAGTYRIQVVAKNAQAATLETTTSVVGTVGSAQIEDGSITLQIGGATVPLDSVQSIREARAAA